MSVEILEMTISDFDEVHTLWATTEGVGLTDGDTREGIAFYLQRNPGTSFVARDGDHLVGAVLCGHDGRRGYLHHLAVLPSYRGQGIGTALVDRCLAGLRTTGILKCNILVFADNISGESFWQKNGWSTRADLTIRQRKTANQSETLKD